MNIDDELLLDAENDAREIEFIRSVIPTEVSERLSDDDLFYLIDIIANYFAETGVLDADPDDDGFINIPIDAMTEYIQTAARKEIEKDFNEEDLAMIIDADLQYAEQN